MPARRDSRAAAMRHNRLLSIAIPERAFFLCEEEGGPLLSRFRATPASQCFISDSNNSIGIGLKIIKYRADLMGASFQIEPASPHGSMLKCSLKIPLNNERRDS